MRSHLIIITISGSYKLNCKIAGIRVVFFNLLWVKILINKYWMINKESYEQNMPTILSQRLISFSMVKNL